MNRDCEAILDVLEARGGTLDMRALLRAMETHGWKAGRVHRAIRGLQESGRLAFQMTPAREAATV